MKKTIFNAGESRRNIRWTLFWNIGLCALCLLALFVCRIILEAVVRSQFQQFGDPASIQAYISGLVRAWVYLSVLCLLWWFGAVNGGRTAFGAQWRDTMERVSFSCSLIVSAIAFIGTILIVRFSEAEGIASVNGFYYPLGFIYILPAVFVLTVYIIPPLDISKVILPRGRYKIAVFLLVVALIYFLWTKDFSLGI